MKIQWVKKTVHKHYDGEIMPQPVNILIDTVSGTVTIAHESTAEIYTKDQILIPLRGYWYSADFCNELLCEVLPLAEQAAAKATRSTAVASIRALADKWGYDPADSRE